MKDRGVEPDPHLQQALRHAPDAALGAPEQLGARIIQAAHQAVAEQHTPPRQASRGWLDRLLPGPASWSRTGAFATVLMALLLTLMWPAQTPGPATDGQPAVAQAPVSQLPQPVTVPPMTPTGQPAQTTQTTQRAPEMSPAADAAARGPADRQVLAAAAPADEQRRGRVGAPPAVGANPAAERSAAAPAPAALDTPAGRRAAAGSAAPAPAPEREQVPRSAPRVAMAPAASPVRTERTTTAGAAPSPAAPPPAAPPPAAPSPAARSPAAPSPAAPSPAAPPAATAPVAPVAPAAQPAEPTAAPDAAGLARGAMAAAPAPRAMAKSGTTAADRAASPAMADLQAPSLPSRLAAAAPPSLAAWLQRQPSDLSWRIDGGPRAAASLPWLQRLAASAGDHWQAGTTPKSVPLPAGTTLELFGPDGGQLARIVLHADHALWCDAAAACRRAMLTPQVMATLQKELPR